MHRESDVKINVKKEPPFLKGAIEYKYLYFTLLNYM